MASSPTVPNNNPATIMVKVFKVELAPTNPMSISATTIRLKVAGGPTVSISSESSGANNMSTKTLTVPPNQLPRAETTNAGPARPFLAISWPSIHVMTDAASPGILTRIEVVDPPYIAP